VNATACVLCLQPLPVGSKLTKQSVSIEEAAEKNWVGTQNPDGTVTVMMCLQCQIDRAEHSKRVGTGR
jgi:hypothetical protein